MDILNMTTPARVKFRFEIPNHCQKNYKRYQGLLFAAPCTYTGNPKK